MNSDPGHIHNLTSTQRLKLAELWAVLLFCLLADSDASLLDLLTDAGEREAVVGIRGQLLKESNEAEAPQDTERRQRQHPKDALSLDLSAFRPQHAALLPEFWRSMGTEHPDVSLLRFLRARKWALIPALEMVLKATKWRIKAGINSFLRDPERDIGFSLSSGKAYIQSYDRLNRPISVSHVAKHEPKAQPLEETMKMCVYLIELGRLMLKGEGETACILFDFRGFGLRNMDYEFVKFLVTTLEANYPESLGLILLLEPPLIFRGVWKIIHSWLDPVVASKVRFGKMGDLNEVVDVKQLGPGFGGPGKGYEYKAPSHGPRGEPDDGEVAATKAFESAYLDLQSKTISYVRSVCAGATDDSRREEAISKLKASVEEARKWWLGETYYHRVGLLEGSCWRG